MDFKTRLKIVRNNLYLKKKQTNQILPKKFFFRKLFMYIFTENDYSVKIYGPILSIVYKCKSNFIINTSLYY